MKMILFLIFIAALFVRFIYFPGNVYFGFDQARDAYESIDIYKNANLKIIGPSTAMENLFHGPIYWYLIGPFYLSGGGDPVLPAGFLLFLNAIGVFAIFWIGKTLSNSKVGVIASLLYAFSFEQTQYAMYFGNPSPAVLTIMLFYGGLALAIFKKKWIGLPFAFLGIGISIQFEFFLIYLLLVFILIFLIFKNEFVSVLNKKSIVLSVICLIVSTITFALAELKFDFRTSKTLFEIMNSVGGGTGDTLSGITVYLNKLNQHITDNLFSFAPSLSGILTISLFAFSIYCIVKFSKEGRRILFLLIWFLSSIFLFIFDTPSLYYSNIGISPGLLLLVSYYIYLIYSKNRLVAMLLVLAILVSNSLLIRGNKEGVINGIYVQEGMILSREKEVIDFIYQKANGRPIVVSALTMPLKINTTWAYLFNWYGKNKYGYLPYWAGEAALGYPGSLPFWKSQEEEYIMFSIVEPVRGVRPAFVDQFLSEQEQYGEITEEKILGKNPQTSLIVKVRGKNER